MRTPAQRPAILAAVVSSLAAIAPAAGQTCQVSVRMYNDNRYAYDTDEECPGGIHSAPFGNWGVSSNVGSKTDGKQFMGWYPNCSDPDGKVEWNSCAVGYVRPDPDCRRLNFPDNWGSYPFPANGYPFSDVYGHNDCAGGADPCRCVDQYSPCGPNDYGGKGWSYAVSAPYDIDCDGNPDWGGCSGLDGMAVSVANNFMTVYELDPFDTDDLIQTLYYPAVSVTLSCDMWGCRAQGDANGDGYLDDLWDRGSPAWVWPTAYYDDWNQQRRRIDATIRIGYARGTYLGPDRECNPSCEPCPDPDPCWPSGICP